MGNPLHISDCVRKDGVTFLVVEGHDLTEADEGRTLKVVGVSDRTVNGTFPISKVIPPSTIQFLQPGEVDIPAGIRGGSVSVEGEAPVKETEQPEVEKVPDVTKETEGPEKHPAPHPASPAKHVEPEKHSAPAPKTHK